jgi:Tfp pilus assembly protein PilO
MTLTVRDRVLLVVVVVVVVVFGFTHFALSPQRHRAASLQTQVTAAQAALRSARDRYATGHAAAASLHGNAPAWAAAQRAVPRVSDIPDLLRLLARSAREAHVSMQSITLAGASASAGSTGAVAPTSSGGATEVPISLSFDGGYQALNRLLAQLDDLVVVSGDSLRASGPLVGISDVSLATGGTGGTGLSLNLTAVIYQRGASNTVLGPDPQATP